MSGISLSAELAGLVDTFAWTWRDLNWLQINAMKSAFCPFEDRLALIDARIKPGFAAFDPDARPGPDDSASVAQGSFGGDLID
jgi:adenosine deaminase